MFERSQKPRPKVSQFEQWARATSEDPEAKAIKEENEQYRNLSKNELIEDMLDIILRHKKEIKKVPQAMYPAGAQKWASRRGLYATETNIDNSPDGSKEVVVFDRKGNPMVVNGYMLKPSDYPVRRKYWDTHQTESSRVDEPMTNWLSKSGTVYTYEDDGMFGKKNIKLTPFGEELRDKWDGFRMPTKPKQQASPYSVFSKLIAPLVKDSFWHSWMIAKFNIANAMETETDPKSVLYYPHIWNKIVSPITLYRYLYLKLIVQKHYYRLKLDRSGNLTYAQYKSAMKRDAAKAEFNKWFWQNCINNKKDGFDKNTVNKGLIDQNLINGNLDLDGSDPNDGLFHLLGGTKNFNDKTTIVFVDREGRDIVFDNIIRDDATAEQLFDILNNRNDPQYKKAKVAMTKFKERAQEYVKSKIFSAAGMEKMMESDKAQNQFLTSMKVSDKKTPNLTEDDGMIIHKMSGGSLGSPEKPMMQEDDGAPDDNEEEGDNEYPVPEFE